MQRLNWGLSMTTSFFRPGTKDSSATRHSISQGGFAILEALVSMLVFALGILGLIGLQGTMTREQTASKVRADAAYLASELVGTMWTDIPNRTLYADGSCMGYARCADWRNKLSVTLPSGTASVKLDDPGIGDVEVTITWTMPGGDEHQYITATTIVASDAS